MRETICVGELKHITPKRINPNKVIKNHNHSSTESEVVRNNKKLREKK